MSNGRIWPYAISASIIFIFGACVATIIVASKLPVEKSDTYMMDYHQANANVNDLINSRIAFDKKYKVDYLTEGLSINDSVVKYRVTDLDSNPVNDAEVKIIITRPNSKKYDIELNTPAIENGVYTFDSTKLPLEGRWDIIAKVNVGELQRFYNIKADTRTKEVKEF
jgi:nitrogen fixation protein FixH